MSVLLEIRPLPRVERLASDACDRGIPVLFQDDSGAILSLSGVEVLQCGKATVVVIRDENGAAINMLQFFGVTHVRLLGDLRGLLGVAT